jgi:cytochrome c peroxidase
MALLLVASAAPAQAPTSRPSIPQLFVDQEPITPIPQPPAADPLKLALGKHLFEDPRLSHDGTRACFSCHDTRTNGADSDRRDTAPDGSQLPLNTNTVFNAALSFRFNWEGDFRTLEAQAEASLENPMIMGTSVDEVLARLKADREMVHRFSAAYGHGPDRASLLDAIATYERSLLTPGSRFDRWLDGGAAALSAKEQDGYRFFKTLGCISCHQGVNVGGNLFQRHGIFYPLASPKPEILRVPSLRNVATTPPYFHDGSAPTLEDAVRRMGRAQLDRTLSNQQVEAIVAFLQTLTGTYRGDLVTGTSP